MRRSIPLAVTIAALLGCAGTTPPVNSYVKLDPQIASSCQTLCSQLGMRLGAVVLVQNSAGCVCEPEGSPGSSRAGAAAVANGALLAKAADAAKARHGAMDAEELPSAFPPPKLP